MKIPYSIELKMFLSKIRNSDFELNSINFDSLLDRGMKLARITNSQLAKRAWAKEQEVRQWRAGIDIPLSLRQISIIHLIEEMMEERISRTEWLEKMNSNFVKWAKAIGFVLVCFLLAFVLLTWIGFTAQTAHPFYYGVIPILLGLVLLFKKAIFP